MQLHNIKFLMVLSLVVLLASCKKNDTPANPDNTLLVQEMIEAMGGTDQLKNAASISYQSVGQAFEFQEDPEPVNGKVADFTYTLEYALAGNQSKQSWNVKTEYAYESDFSFVETIEGTKGSSEGTTGFFSQFFAGFGVEGDPMFSTKLAARQKTLLMSSPLALAQLVNDQSNISGNALGTVGTGYNTSSLGFGANTPDVELIIDTETKMPLKAQALENDPLYGDVLYEVVYSDWITVNNLKVPSKLTHILNGHTIRTETLSNHTIHTSVNTDNLRVASSDWTYSQAEARYGYLSSQFHFRTLMQTFALDFPVEYTDQTSPLALPSEAVANDPNVFRISGDFQSHYTYAFKVNGELVLYDSPVNNRRSAAVLSKIRSSFSTDPIKYVVNSHNHFDHVGGVRGNLAEGGELVVGEGSKASYEAILKNPHTVLPNPIEGKTVNVIGVTSEMTIGTGDDQLVLYTLATEHAEHNDYVVIYKPSTKTIYSNDVYNPGFINIFDYAGTANQHRLALLAKNLVTLVDSKGLDVQTSYCSHGFTTMDYDFATVRALANK